MDVIINNPPAQSVPQAVAPAPSYVQGYGAAPAYPGYPPYRDHDGPGFFGVLLLVLGGAALFRAFRRRQFRDYRRRMAGANGANAGSDAPQDRGEGGWPDFFGGRGRGFLRGDDALTIARERFARGEIDAAQFEAIKKGLTE